MILSRYLRSEVVKTSLSILLVLILIFTLQRFVYYLRDAAAGQLATSLVGHLLLLQIPRIIGLLLPLALFLGTLIALSRMYLEQEITVMRACGIGQLDLVKFLTKPAFILSLTALFLSLWVTPWAVEQQYKLLDQQAAQADVALLQPGRFQQSADGKNILYIQEQNKKGLLSNIFLSQKSLSNEGKVRVITATKGKVVRNQDRFLLLESGQRFEGKPGDKNFSVVEFGEYLNRLTDSQVVEKKRSLDAINTHKLLAMDGGFAAAEFQWRVSMGLSALILVFIAIPLARVRPRQGKFAKLAPGLLLYVFYLMMMIVSKNWLENERLSSFIGIWWVHLMMILIALWLLDFVPKGLKSSKNKLKY